MDEIQLSAQQHQADLEVRVNRASKVKVLLHQLKQCTSIQIANCRLEKGNKKVLLQKDQLEEGVYIYTVSQDDIPTDFGRLIVK